MNGNEIVDTIVNGHFHYKNWEFFAYGRTDGTVKVEIEFETVNSSNPEDDPRPFVLAEGEGIIDPAAIHTVHDLEDAMLNIVHNVELHEMTEFFRVGERKVAPYHPHRADGIHRWNEVRGKLDNKRVGEDVRPAFPW